MANKVKRQTDKYYYIRHIIENLRLSKTNSIHKSEWSQVHLQLNMWKDNYLFFTDLFQFSTHSFFLALFQFVIKILYEIKYEKKTVYLFYKQKQEPSAKKHIQQKSDNAPLLFICMLNLLNHCQFYNIQYITREKNFSMFLSSSPRSFYNLIRFILRTFRVQVMPIVIVTEKIYNLWDIHLKLDISSQMCHS